MKAAVAGGIAVPVIAGGVVAWRFGVRPAGPAPVVTATNGVIPVGGSVSSVAFGPKNDLLAVGLSDGDGGVVV